jgi:hypothetical protein
VTVRPENRERGPEGGGGPRGSGLDVLQRYVEKRTRSWRLALAFRRAWESLPQWQKVELLDLWIGHNFSGLPEFVLVPGLRVNGEDALAACADCGLTLLFRSSLADRLSVAALTVIVKHELWHCYQYATGRPTSETEARAAAGDLDPETREFIDRFITKGQWWL